MTRVVHCKREQYDVYIGRPASGLKGSIWGNPFKIGRDGTREEVIAKYREYVLGKPELLRQLESLRGKVLGCWCSPQKCPGRASPIRGEDRHASFLVSEQVRWYSTL